METTTFLGAALGFIALLLVLFLYINRKWCFATPGSFPCCDELTLPAKTVHTIRKYTDNYIIAYFKGQGGGYLGPTLAPTVDKQN